MYLLSWLLFILDIHPRVSLEMVEMKYWTNILCFQTYVFQNQQKKYHSIWCENKACDYLAEQRAGEHLRCEASARTSKEYSGDNGLNYKFKTEACQVILSEKRCLNSSLHSVWPFMVSSSIGNSEPIPHLLIVHLTNWEPVENQMFSACFKIHQESGCNFTTQISQISPKYWEILFIWISSLFSFVHGFLCIGWQPCHKPWQFGNCHKCLFNITKRTLT